MSNYVEMLGGLRMPFPGFGTASFPSPEVLEQSVETALEAGYRHFDTAYIYNNSEETIGKVFKRWISAGKIKREDLFVVTKLPRQGVDPSKVEYYLKESLKRLRLDYVDLYLIHHPVYSAPSDGSGPGRMFGAPLPTDHIGTWKKMEEQVDAGRTKSIGLSNFDTRQIERIWQIARIKPSCLQVKISIFLQRANFVKFCRDKGIVVVGFSMLNPPRQDDSSAISTNVFTNEVVSNIAKKHGKNNGQVVLRYFIQKHVVGIPKSTNKERIEANISLFDFSLDSEDVKILEGLHVGKAAIGRTMADRNPELKNHPEYPNFDD